MDKLIIQGTKKEQQLFNEVNQHYDMAREDNEARWNDWDRKYELFRSYINESEWPYSAQVFIPHTFQTVFEKMARLNGGKPRGRLIPREGGDVIKAKVNNELLNFQWDEASRIDNLPMVEKWSRMDMQARIYGGSFAVIKWRYETDSDGNPRFDGPTMKVLPVKDSLPNPSYSTIKNWFQYRDYVTLRELETINDVSKEKPTYKNLDKLRSSLLERSKKGGDTRDLNYIPRGREIQGLTDYLGRDESPDFKTVEVVTELRDDRTIVFAPKHGVILRDEENPYNHKQIPVVQLKYISIDDDIWGLSELEPVEKVQKAMNALTSQFIDAVNMDLYRIVKVRPTGVQMHTLEWGPGKKWLMNNPDDVVPLEHSLASTSQFTNVYSVLTAVYKEAMGDTSAAYSALQPFGTEKTATEIQEGQLNRSVRDNYNQIFLAEAIKKQMMLWLLMNKQFVFSDPRMTILPIRVVGRDSVQEFLNAGMGDEQAILDDVLLQAETEFSGEGVQFEPENKLNYPVEVDGEEKPKFELDETGDSGLLYMTPEDMTGNYDYVADVEPMRAGNTIVEKQALREAIQLALNPNGLQLMQMEGKMPALTEMLIDLFEREGIKGADRYFVSSQGGLNGNPINQGGAGDTGSGGIPPVNQGNQGMGVSGAATQNQGLPQLG